ncbi:MAG: endonuclease/exonuclease/phosphatase family protein [Flavobacteriales bacterium]|nr:endonuclease/exonuclease/phosphatase family protein [Flavobacteriales bacterium]
MLIIKLVLKILNALAALALALAFGSVYITPTSVPYVSTIGLLVPALIAINVFFVLVWILWKDLFFLYSLIAILVGWGQLPNIISFGANKDEENYDKVTLMSYNVCGFYGFEDIKNEDVIINVTKTISVYDPDIICFQEYRTVPIGVSSWKHRFSDKSTAIYSKKPFINTGSLSFENTGNNAVFADIEVAIGDTIRVYSVHLQSLRISAKEVNYLTQTDELTEGVKGLLTRVNAGFETQAAQVKKIRESIDSSPYPVVVAGDFNNTPFSYSYKKVRGKDLCDAFVQAGSGLGATFRAIDVYPLRIDYVMANKDAFGVKSFMVITDEKSSDHYPVVSVLGINNAYFIARTVEPKK